MVFSAKNTIKALNIKNNSSSLLCLPPEYIAGKMMIVRAIVNKMNLITTLPSALPTIEKYVDFSAMTALQVKNIIDNDISELNKIGKLIIGGGKIDQNVIESLQSVNTEIYETYGMTETASHIALKQINGINKSDFFTILNGIDIESNENNQLLITSIGLGVNKLLTNDIVRIISPTKFQWVGRLDNVINSGGIKLYPEEIESKLKSHIDEEIIIFGIEEPKYGNICCLAIEGKERELKLIFEKHLSKYEIPKRIFFLSNFPRTISNKIIRQKVIDQISNL
ncbi:MAG: hypothetical protein R2771_05845 [Saprospiraceae bacterium]